MAQCTFRFYGDLNDLIAPARQQVPFTYTFTTRTAIKDVIEALGVPHTEVEQIIVHDRAVDFTYIVQDGDRVSVYPIAVPIAGTTAVPIRPALPPRPGFVLDTHLGQLAAYLRMLGFDALYRNDYTDEELAHISSRESRVLLTRDRGLLKRSIVTYGHYMRETNPQRQVVEVLRRYDLFAAIEPFRRCIRCNGLLEPVPKSAVQDRLPPDTRQNHDMFHMCQACSQVYWKGSHYRRMLQFIERVRNGESASARPPCES